MFILTRLFRFLFAKTVSSPGYSTKQEQSFETTPLHVDDQRLDNSTTTKIYNDDAYDTDSLPVNNLNYWIHRKRHLINVEMALAERADAFNVDITTKKTARFVLDDPPPIVNFKNKNFIFSGVFKRAREDYERDIRRRFGVIESYICHRTNYLVLGPEADKRWRYIIFGTKVDDVFEHKEKGYPIAIISEEHLLAAIESTEPKTRGPAVVLGKIFFLTGRFKKINHECAREIIEQAGGYVSKTLTKRNVDYVVVGSNSTKMLEKAHDWGKTILTETEFLALLEQDL